MRSLAAEFLSSVTSRFREYKALGDKTFAQLTEQDFHQQPNEVSNSIAVIVKHLHGNMKSRWTAFLNDDGEKPWRQRDAEFETGTETKEEILAMWEEGWSVLFSALENLSEEDLLKTVAIRTKPLGVVDAVNRQLAHYSYHVGQIVYLGRWSRREDWQSLSIPKNASDAYNAALRKA